MFLLGLTIVGVVVVFSFLMVDLYRELLADNSDGGVRISPPVLGDLSALRRSESGTCREALPTKETLPNNVKVAAAAADHPREILEAGESVSVKGSDIVTFSGYDRMQATHAGSAFTGSSAGDREDDEVFGRPQNESGVSAPSDDSRSVGDASPKEMSLSIPLFYALKASQFDLLPPEQQQAVVSLQNDYINYHNDWTEASSGDISQWNDRMKEFHLELVRRVGPSAADALTR